MKAFISSLTSAQQGETKHWNIPYVLDIVFGNSFHYNPLSDPGSWRQVLDPRLASSSVMSWYLPLMG